MKIVQITTRKQYQPIKGRIYDGICEYDDELLEAHKMAKEMSEIMGISMTSLKYRVAECSRPLGAILSYDVNTSSARLEDERMQSASISSIYPMKNEPVEWHVFEEIDVKEYEKSVFLGDEYIESLKEDVF